MCKYLNSDIYRLQTIVYYSTCKADNDYVIFAGRNEWHPAVEVCVKFKPSTIIEIKDDVVC